MLAFRSLLLFGAGASSADPEEVARAAEDKAQPLPHIAYICYISIDLISYTYLTYISGAPPLPPLGAAHATTYYLLSTTCYLLGAPPLPPLGAAHAPPDGGRRHVPA